MKIFLRIIGITFIFSPVFLYWFIHGDYERYIEIINGPYPFSHMGSAPFQMAVYLGLFIFGVIITIASFKLKK